MNVGIVHETRNQEHRVALNPAGVAHLTGQGVTVFVQSGAGVDSGWADHQYSEAGASIVYSPEEIWGRSDVLMKISPLEREEVDLIRDDQTILSWQHLIVRHPDVIRALMDKRSTVIGYEMIEQNSGLRPLVAGVAEIAGYVAVSTSVHYLQNEEGGRAKIIAGVAGVPQGSIVILGAGLTGQAAAAAGVGNGAYVIVIDKDAEKLRNLEKRFGGRITTYFSNAANIAKAVSFADVVIACAATPGDIAPKLISEEMVKSMKYRAILADLSIDQGGCAETSHPTSLANPTFIKHDVVHYCVPNMTANVSRTTSSVISNGLLRYLDNMIEMGVAKAVKTSACLRRGTFLYQGLCVRESIARHFDLKWESLPL